MKKSRKNARGITLVALVVTIIVLLILAGVSLNLVAGRERIIEKASKAADEQTKASMKEQVALYVSELTYDYYLNNPEGKTYLAFMAEKLENKEDAIIDIVEQSKDELIINYTQGKNILQLSLSSDGTIEIVGSGTTSSGIEDTYAPKISYDASTTSSITVTLKDSSGVEAYACSLENAKPSIDSSSWNKIESPSQTKQITITGLTANQTYYVFAKDTKGNISEGKVCKTIDYAQVVVTYKESSTAQTVLETINTKHTEIITLISKPSSLNKEGYDFIGWAESEDAEEALGTEYTVPNHNVTLYPVWEPSQLKNYMMLYYYGDECIDVTGGWTGYGTFANNGTMVGFYTNNPVNTSGYICIAEVHANVIQGLGLSSNTDLNSLKNNTGGVGFTNETTKLGWNVTHPKGLEIYDISGVNQTGFIWAGTGEGSIDCSRTTNKFSDYLHSRARDGTGRYCNLYMLAFAKSDNVPELCSLIDVSYTNIDDILNNHSSDLLNNKQAVNYMLKYCTGQFMFHAISNTTFKNALNSSSCKNDFYANEHWAKFLNINL